MTQTIAPPPEQTVDARLHLLPQSNQLRALHTVIRDRTAPRAEFVCAGGRILRMLVEAALDLLPYEQRRIETPVGKAYDGLRLASPVCGVSVARAGESMESELRAVCPSVRIGKILIQRDKTTKLPRLYESWLPADIASRQVLLLDPMLATGGTARTAIRVLREAGVAEEHIVFVSLIAVPEGISAVRKEYSRVRIVTSAIDDGLNESAYMMPGIGDFGDRYFGTDN